MSPSRMRRIATYGILTFAIGLLALVSGFAWLSLSSAGRAIVASRAGALLSDLLAGDLRIGRIEALSPSHIVLREVVVRDQYGVLLITSPRVEASFVLWPLLHGALRFDTVAVDAPWVSLHLQQDGKLAIAEAFLPVDDGAARDEPASPSTFEVTIRRIILRGGTLVNGLPGFSLHDLALQTDLAVHGVAVRLSEVSGACVVVGGEGLRAPARIHEATLRFAPDEASKAIVTASMDGDRVRVEAHAHWGKDGPTQLRAQVDGEVSPTALERAGLSSVAAQLRGRFGLHVEGQLALPSREWSARGRLHTDGGDVQLEGAYTAASANLRVQSREWLLERALAVDGVPPLRFDLSLTARPTADDRIALQLDARDLHVDRQAVPEVHVGAVWSPGTIRLRSLDVPRWESRGGRIHTDVRLDYEEGTIEGRLAADLPTIDPPGLLARLTGGSVGRVSLELAGSYQGGRQVLRADGFVRVGDVQLGSVRADLLEATLHARGDLARPLLDARVDVTGLSISGRRVARASAALSGNRTHYRLRAEARDADASLGADLSLTLGEPEIRVSGSAHAARRDAALGSLSLEAAFSPARSTGSLSLSLATAAQHRLTLTGRAKLGPAGPWSARFQRARYALTLEGQQDLSELEQLITGRNEPSLRGTLRLSGESDGPLDGMVGHLSVEGRSVGYRDGTDVGAKLAVAWSRTSGQLSLDLARDAAPLAALNVELGVGTKRLFDTASLSDVLALPATYKVLLQERMLSILPSAWRLNLPIHASAEAELRTSPIALPSARLSAEASFTDEAPRCAGTDLPRLFLSATLRSDELSARLKGEVSGREILLASLSGVPPRHAATGWMMEQRGKLALALDLRGVELSHLPRYCGKVEGAVDLSLQGAGLLGPDPRISGTTQIKALRVGEGQPVDVSVDVRADRAGLQIASLRATQGSEPRLRAHGDLPWGWDGLLSIAPELARCSVDAELKDLPLQSLLEPAIGTAQASGTIAGHLKVRGCTAPFAARGELAVSDVSLLLRKPSMRIDQLDARLRFTPELWELVSFELLDQEGSFSADGHISLVQGVPARGELHARAKDFPLRNQGGGTAMLDGQIDLSAWLDEEPYRLALRLSGLSVEVPQSAGRKPLTVGAHPDVIYTHIERDDTSGSRVQRSDTTTPLVLDLSADRPFWVRRSDFGVLVDPNLRLQVDAKGSRVSGEVQVQRGFLDVMSKGFTIERGLLHFDGGARIDPTLTLSAVHKLSDGHTVTIRVRDRLSAPVVSFATDVPGVSTDAEVMQLLVRGRDASFAEAATAQVGAALAGLTSGLLARVNRGDVGQFVPVLALEAGASSGTRMRAGVEANALIPRSLRRVIEGAYIEGFVGSKNQGGQAQATGGVLVDLYFPRRVVAEGSWELPNNWSVETTWEP